MFLGPRPDGPNFKPEREIKRFSQRERAYFGWLHSFNRCCLTGRPEIEIAHTGGLSQGKGMSLKAHLNTCLPLLRDLHHHEEKSGPEFWENAGVPDYLAFADRLHEIWKQGGNRGDAEALLADMCAKANRPYLMRIMIK